VLLIALATLPIAVVGVGLYLFAESFLSDSVRDPTAVGWLLLVTAGILAVGEIAGRHHRSLHALGIKDAALVGGAQVLAALPGISRSGVTISAGMVGHMTRETSARFSFFLAAPAILGDGSAQALDLIQGEVALTNDEWSVLIVAAVAAFVSALAAIKGLMILLHTRSLRPFIGYCIVAGIAVLLARAAGY
ncbi:MAG: undecaprenyl-diphosphate phosphatase, partial [Chloroflexota bacterium]